MALTTPQITIQPQSTFDSTQDFQITFNVVGGDQISANEIVVSRISDNSIVYDNKQETFTLSHIIPMNTLTNGIAYKVQIKTFNINNDSSQFSDWIPINCYSNPIIDIDITDNGTWNNQNLAPQGSYFQTENDPLQYYKYILYDSSMSVLGESNILRDGLLTYQFAKLDNNRKFTIELQATTKHNVTISVKKTFTTEYIKPQYSNLLTLTNNPEQASVNVSIIAVRTLGHIKSGNVTFEDGEYANCLNGNVQFDDQNNDGLYFKYNNGNWQMQLWLKGLVDNKIVIDGHYEGTLICPIYGDDGTSLKLQYFNGAFHILKYINNILFSSYSGDIINAKSDDNIYLFINCQNDRFDIISIILPKTIILSESIEQTRTYSTTINNLDTITSVTVDKGQVSYTVNGNTINLTITGGNPSRIDRNNKSTTISKISPINQFDDSIPYNDENDYSGTLYKNGISTYSVINGSQATSKYVTIARQYQWTIQNGSIIDKGGYIDAIPYDDTDGYVGILNVLRDDQFKNNVALWGATGDGIVTMTFNYGGNVSKPDTRQYSYTQNYTGIVYGEMINYYSYIIKIAYTTKIN